MSVSVVVMVRLLSTAKSLDINDDVINFCQRRKATSKIAISLPLSELGPRFICSLYAFSSKVLLHHTLRYPTYSNQPKHLRLKETIRMKDGLNFLVGLALSLAVPATAIPVLDVESFAVAPNPNITRCK